MTAEPVDKLSPWTIKGISPETRDRVHRAARREAMTVGQWLEKHMREYEADGSPIPVAMAPVDLVQLAALIEAIRGMAKDAKVPIPQLLVRNSFSALRRAIRAGQPRALALTDAR